MDLKGNLRVFEPISVFQMLNLSLATGELLLKIKGNAASVFFDRGKVTYAEIANRPVRLGEYLVGEGLISRKQLEGCLAKREEGKKLGSILVEEGVLDEGTLERAIEEQIKEVIYEVVKWREGLFVFTAGKRPSAQDIFIDIPLDHLMLEGLKRMDEEGEKA